MNPTPKKRGKPAKIAPPSPLPSDGVELEDLDLEQELTDFAALTASVDQVDDGGADVENLIDGLPQDALAGLYDDALRVVRDLALGIRVAKKTKQPQLNKGQVAEWKLETAEGEVWVYQKEPNLRAATYIIDRLKGKPGTAETEAKATTLVLKLAVPGHDSELDRHLASLDDDALSKYGFDEETLARIKAYRTT